jgi:hypothetical protein
MQHDDLLRESSWEQLLFPDFCLGWGTGVLAAGSSNTHQCSSSFHNSIIVIEELFGSQE